MKNDSETIDSDTSSDSSSDTDSNTRSHDISKASKSRPSKSKDVRTPAPGFSPSVPTVGSVAEHDMKGKRNVQNDKSKDFPAPPPGYPLRVRSSSFSIHSLVSLSRITMGDGKDFSKVVITNDHYEYILAKYEKWWVHDESIVGIVYNDLLERVNMKPKLVKAVNAPAINVASSSKHRRSG
ncbi:hypothetical protein Tco_0647685 [Tanacetum coccineum]